MSGFQSMRRKWEAKSCRIYLAIWCKDMEIWTCERSRLVHCDWNSSNAWRSGGNGKWWGSNMKDLLNHAKEFWILS